jgi:hypothetical protein
MFKQSIVAFLQISIVLLFVVPSSAHAYLDPGTTSFILQILSAALVTALAFWGKLKSTIKGFFQKKEK